MHATLVHAGIELRKLWAISRDLTGNCVTITFEMNIYFI